MKKVPKEINYICGWLSFAFIILMIVLSFTDYGISYLSPVFLIILGFVYFAYKNLYKNKSVGIKGKIILGILIFIVLFAIIINYWVISIVSSL